MIKKGFYLLTVSVALAFLVKWTVVELFTVPTASMEPTILRGSKVWLFKLPFQRFERGSVVGFEREGEYFVKRIVAMPTDSVYFDGYHFQVLHRDKFVYFNPTLVCPIPKKGMTVSLNADNFSFYRSLIEKNEGVQAVQVLDKIYINATLSNTYTFKQDYFFLQGDNTEGSIDSRQLGLIGRNQIMGHVWFEENKGTISVAKLSEN